VSKIKLGREESCLLFSSSSSSRAHDDDDDEKKNFKTRILSTAPVFFPRVKIQTSTQSADARSSRSRLYFPNIQNEEKERE
jgi:hypothetical protein